MKKGFTLIELLVVISIIGILAALTLTGFSAARKNARDTQRKSDLGQYRVALEAYSSTNGGKYPYNACPAATCTGNSYANSGIFGNAANSPLVPEYLPTHIEDPTNVLLTYNYVYYQDTNTSGLEYKLFAGLETGGYWEICSSGKAGKFSTLPPASSTCDLP